MADKINEQLRAMDSKLIKPDSLAIFKYILDVRSMTVIERKVEDKLAFDNPEDEVRTALNSILATRSLDEVWAICHDMLGQHEQAQILRDWIAQPKPDTGSETALLTEELADGVPNYHPEVDATYSYWRNFTDRSEREVFRKHAFGTSPSFSFRNLANALKTGNDQLPEGDVMHSLPQPIIQVEFAKRTVVISDFVECNYAVVRPKGEKARKVYWPKAMTKQVKVEQVLIAAGIAARRGWRRSAMFLVGSIGSEVHLHNFSQAISETHQPWGLDTFVFNMSV